MPCDQRQLNALADGELSAWAAARVRRHLRTCSVCATEYQAIETLSTQTGAWRDVTAPTGMETRIAAALSLPRPQEQTVGPRKRLAWRPIVAMAVAAIIFAAVALFTPGQPGQPTVAFADVERAMQQVNVIHCTQLFEEYEDNDVTQTQSHSEVWLRRNPPGIMMHTVYDKAEAKRIRGRIIKHIRESIIVADTRRGIDYQPKNHRCYLSPPDPPQVEAVFRSLTNPTDTHWPTGGRKLELASSADPERVTLSGHPALKFVLSGQVTRGPLITKTVWADPDTRRIIQIEERDTSQGNVTVWLFRDIRYDELPPADAFDMTPPPGAKTVPIP